MSWHYDEWEVEILSHAPMRTDDEAKSDFATFIPA